MVLTITEGKIQGPVKGVIYGPEGVGKSTLASLLPRPVFCDVENGTREMAVKRLPTPSSWTHFLEIVRQITADQMGYETIVIDTADKLERLAINHICGTTGYSSLGGRDDFGRSYNELAGLWESLLTALETDLILSKKMNVVFLAHSETRKFELPEEEGSFDRYELALEKKVRPLLKEWADLLLFCNYKTIVSVETNREGKVVKARGAGGTRRVYYSQHSAAFDAKNRHGLPFECDMAEGKLGAIEPVFAWRPIGSLAHAYAPATTPAPPQPPTPVTPVPNARLVTVMQESGVQYGELLSVMVARGKTAQGTPIENINEGLIDQWILPHWDKIRTAVVAARGETTNG